MSGMRYQVYVDIEMISNCLTLCKDNYAGEGVQVERITYYIIGNIAMTLKSQF